MSVTDANTKEQLVKNVKAWIQMDNEIKDDILKISSNTNFILNNENTKDQPIFIYNQNQIQTQRFLPKREAGGNKNNNRLSNSPESKSPIGNDDRFSWSHCRTK